MPERPCPVCGKPLARREQGGRGPQPFCSERCRQVDLGRWLSGGYAVPAEEEEPPAKDDR